MLGVLSIFSLDFLALECLNLQGSWNVYYTTVILWCLLPLVIAIGVILIGVFRCTKAAILSKTEREYYINSVKDQHVWMLLFLSYIVLPPVSNKQLQAFDCISLQSGETYLRSDTSIDCGSSGYKQFISGVGFFIGLYQLIPITWMFILSRKREALNPPTSNHDPKLALFIRDNNKDLHFLKFLFVDYKCSKWWFEVADMYRRIIFIGIIPLVSPNPATRSSFGCMLAIMSAAYFREEQPYRVDFTNVIAHVAQV
jgi:hypothetical protein